MNLGLVFMALGTDATHCLRVGDLYSSKPSGPGKVSSHPGFLLMVSTLDLVLVIRSLIPFMLALLRAGVKLLFRFQKTPCKSEYYSFHQHIQMLEDVLIDFIVQRAAPIVQG